VKDIAIVTGSSGGIGSAIADVLKNDFEIVSLSHTLCDITDQSEVKDAFKELNKIVGMPKILINCAGYVNPKAILDTTIEEWERQIKVNLSGVFLCVKEFMKYNKTGGKIINIASTAGMRPSPGHAAYGAAKAGLINFSQSLSEELYQYGIKVYCIVPGRCATNLRKKLAPDEDQSKIMQPIDVANFVAALVNTDYPVDGNPIVIRRRT
jgi:3-oxoacyl-[acyl-carrier protein] reductase